MGGGYVSGKIRGTVISNDREAMTFFGPTGCTRDSGLIINAYFTETPLKSDGTTIQATWSSAIYYDNIGNTHVFESLPENDFWLIIDVYERNTGKAQGRLGGKAKMLNGEMIPIEGGRFNIRIKP
ncbi:hypothetical protein FPE01S_04_01870 [Flavihumibacter petaseus NBRC 106054]|uniref:Uncharacterized protein n=2 Tax=Flavihumibacter TaxID=1004301 RepID=A0A0E9N552_9BACT|nr:hypothetical protein FPE01S_04_01870 [Flavihumibacter petaseus NBRC 106054]